MILKRIIKRLFKKGNYEQEYRIKNGLKVGKNTSVFSWEGIDANWPWLISIGDNVTVSSGVTILAHDASTNKVGCHTKLGLVSIGNNCFIGAKSTILCNVRIGDNVVVGAGSVVPYDLESGYVYAGNPAIKICSFEEYRDKNKRLNKDRPYFASIRKWYDWINATEDEKVAMIHALKDGIGFI